MSASLYVQWNLIRHFVFACHVIDISSHTGSRSGIVKERGLQINSELLETHIYTRNPLTLLQEGVSVNCKLSLFLEYWCKIAPVLDLECTDVSDGISEPVCRFQCFYRSVKVCHIVPFGKIYTPLRIVESIFTQDYSYLEIGVVIWLSILLFKV